MPSKIRKETAIYFGRMHHDFFCCEYLFQNWSLLYFLHIIFVLIGPLCL